jgi:CubicO group peptidase (beta-lactamase class C family)
MRVIDLLRHTSGLTYGFQLRTNVDAAYRSLKVDPFEAESLESFVETLGRLPLEFSPGTAWNYSVSTDVIGHLVGVVSGMPFDDFIRTRMLQPLGMRDTDFFLPEAKVSRFADCYVKSAAGKLEPAPPVDFSKPPRAPSGGGGLVSTAADYLRFCEMLRRGGELDGVRLLGPRTLRLMTANQLPGHADLEAFGRPLFSETTFDGVGFGLGFSVVEDPVAARYTSSRGEFGWGGAASTAFWVDREERMEVQFFTQLLPSSTHPIRSQLHQLVHQALID